VKPKRLVQTPRDVTDRDRWAMDAMDTWTREWALPASPQSVRRARDVVAGRLREVGLLTLIDDARLVVSELTSNAVQHARTPFTLVVASDEEGLLLSVSDEAGPWRPAHRADPVLAEQGRGLRLVELLSAAWGVAVQAGSGKTVWARLATASDGEGAGSRGSRGVRDVRDESPRPSRSRPPPPAPTRAGRTGEVARPASSTPGEELVEQRGRVAR
jgi:anti-sigma regulatory factor (Ser/Thr protein kinase)